jgi:hypothetical protein
MMEAEGIAVVERVPLVTGTNRHNAHYLRSRNPNRGICCDAARHGPDAHGPAVRGRVFPCTIGGAAASRTDKREGTARRLRAVHRIIGCLYRPDRMARPCDWAVPIRPGDLWSDDPGTRTTTSWCARPTASATNGCGGATGSMTSCS